VLGTECYLQAAVQGGRWLVDVQNSDGSLYRYYGPDLDAYIKTTRSRLKPFRKAFRPRETGSTAQAMRIWLSLNEETGCAAFHSAAERAASFILPMQWRKRDDPDALGGFHARCDKLWNVQWLSPELYSWTTMFACQGIALARQIADGNRTILPELF